MYIIEVFIIIFSFLNPKIGFYAAAYMLTTTTIGSIKNLLKNIKANKKTNLNLLAK